MKDQLSQLQPQFERLTQSQEQLQSLGQPASEEEVRRLTETYAELQAQTTLQLEKLEKAVSMRRQYSTLKGEVEHALKDCQEQMEAVDVLGVAVHTKLDRYRVGRLDFSVEYQ